MLILQRYVNEKIITRIDEDDLITFSIHSIIGPNRLPLPMGCSVKIAIDADKKYWVDREEIYLRKILNGVQNGK